MKGSREALSKYLTKQYELNMREKKKIKATVDYMVDADFPVIEVTDVVQLRKNTIDCSDRMLYYLTKATELKLLGKPEAKTINDYFTDREIKEYETTKYKKTKITFPLKWNMIEVVEGSQWIGRISVKELMKLRDAQLINYNERTQRTLKRVENKDFEYYQIYLNRTAVDAIEKSYAEGQYIPNTITLNLPEDADFKYSDGVLTIKEVERLDIIDGYHRYIAMSNIYNRDPGFDYEMELRVVCFNEDTAKQFIWQEDQKTKMRKMDSETFNQNSPANQVINLINQSGLYRNVIGRNNSVIDQGLASHLITKLWFNTTKVIKRKTLLDVRDEILQSFDQLLEEDPEIFDRKWSYEFTIVAFILLKEKIAPKTGVVNAINKTIKMIYKKEDPKVMLGRKGSEITVKTITRVIKFYQENIEKEV